MDKGCFNMLRVRETITQYISHFLPTHFRVKKDSRKKDPQLGSMGAETRPSFLARHKPSLVVLASQISAAVVHGLVKTLENGGTAVDPFQILLIRMAITGVGCSLFLWTQKVPEFPLGEREVRTMLLLRAVGGILGAGGMYCRFMAPLYCLFRILQDDLGILSSSSFSWRSLTTLQTRSSTLASPKQQP